MEGLSLLIAALCGCILGWIFGVLWARRKIAAEMPSVSKPISPVPALVPDFDTTLKSRSALAWEQRALALQAEKIVELTDTLTKVNESIYESFDAFRKCGLIADDLRRQNSQLHVTVSEAAHEADSATSAAKAGIHQVDDELASVAKFRDVVGRSTYLIGELKALSARIGRFLSQISGVARRTNLLALNAGIEAARAGEAGRGFAVVAQEIRVLAESSARIVSEMTLLLGEIQDRTDEIVNTVSANEAVEQSFELTASAGEIFGRIVDEIEKNTGSLEMVKDSISEQNKDQERLTKAIHETMEQTLQTQTQIEKVSVQAQALGDGLKSIQKRPAYE
jgi:methyl-accepting chemotaxis protein